MRRLHRGRRPPHSGKKLGYRAINACIALLGSLDGRRLITIEHLRQGGTLHPVQQAMVDHHGSQCGFCTPGIVMSLFALWLNEEDAGEERIEDALAGNLCRCTGYQPIIAAGRDMFSKGAEAKAAWRNGQARIAKRLAALQDERTLEIVKDGRRFIAPASLDDFAKAYENHPDATILAGATDVGLWITKEMRVLDTVISSGAHRGLGGNRGYGARSSRIGAMTASPTHPRRSSACTRILANCCGASAASRSGMPARSAATSPTARRSATCRPP